jgi:cation diffusion facilitator family transporter
MLDTCSMVKKDTGIFLANERKTKWVTIITLITMVIEITVGYWSNSMALLADGWHMASHTLALSLSLIVYYLYRHPRFHSSFTFGGGKILSLGGYTSALFLVLIAGSMIYESIHRFYEVRAIHYNEAIGVAVFGLIINLICALIMHSGEDDHGHSHSHGHHHHHHGDHCHHPVNKLAPQANHQERPKAKVLHDHNHHSAYVHILTDALTSLLAIIALVLGRWRGWDWLDPFVGIIGGIVVFKWSLGLIRQSGMDLLDAHDGSIDRENLIKRLETDGSKVIDIHLWKLSPGQVGCELIIKRNREQCSSDYRDMISKDFDIHHLVIEVI